MAFYYYDEQGRVSRIESNDYLFGTTKLSYDENGQLTSSTTTKGWAGQEGEGYTCTIVTEYDNYQNPVKETCTYRSPDNWLYKDGEVRVTTHQYEYNTDGTIKVKKTFIDGKLYEWYSYTYEYDATGKLTTMYEEIHEDTKSSEIKIIYTYDKNGNCIYEEMISVKNNTLMSIVRYVYLE